MSKIRINELARELEVKPGVILEMLPELGVTEKKTHSSSIDDELADRIRARFRREAEPSPAPPAPAAEPPAPAPAPAPAPRAETVAPPAPPQAKPGPAPETPAPSAPEEPQAKPGKPVPAPPNVAPAAVPKIPVPPVHGGGPARPAPPPTPHVPPIPIPPKSPAAPAEKRPPVPSIPRPPVIVPPSVAGRTAAVAEKPGPAPAMPGPARPPAEAVGAPAAPAAPAPPAEKAKAAEVQAKAIPSPPAAAPAPAAPPKAPAQPARPAAPRPGQILSGPRQPLPGGEIPRPPVVVPGIPKPPVTSPPARPAAPAAQGAPGAPAAQTTPARPLAGQPAARPVVPPRPDLLEKLRKTQAGAPKAMPGQPAAPRPGMPVPGQPIYPGARRPAGPGRPGQPAPGGRPVRARGPHPTTPVLEPPPPSTEARREAGKKRATQREREAEKEGILKPFGRKQEPMTLPVVDKEIAISEGITVKELSEKLGVKASLVIKRLVEKSIFATINQPLDIRLCEELCREFGARPTRMSYEEEAVQEMEQAEVDADLVPRPPVVTVMGHVDHGKTSLLDAIRHTNVADKEAGGITQHIGAYQVELNGRKVVFIDTPGHEAFTHMRARGADVTDIVVLVVAADDGVMPQTKEAIDHARAAGVPIIVAVNKIDKPEAQPERVKQQLTELGLMPEEWGGDTPFVPVSAKQKQNLDLLLEMILLVADMQELKANPNRPAVATVLEAKLDKGRGPVATVLVSKGTLRVGDYFLCGSVFGKVRALFDDRSRPVKEAGPSMPVEIVGFESLPEVGDSLQVVTDVAKARQIAEFREMKAREAAQAKTRVSLEQLHTQLREGEVKELNIILKTDVGGTAEVLSETLQKLSTDKVQIRVISAGVGAITESDVDLADASNAIIIGFNVRPDRKAQERAQQAKVDIRLHTIIYELTDEIKKAMLGMLEPVYREVFKGRAEVKEIFRIAKVGTVAGCVVVEGVIPRDAEVRLLRDNVVVYTGRIESLKRFKNDASEVRQGQECGMALAGFQDIKPGDIIEAFVKEKVAPDLGV